MEIEINIQTILNQNLTRFGKNKVNFDLDEKKNEMNYFKLIQRFGRGKVVQQ